MTPKDTGNPQTGNFPRYNGRDSGAITGQTTTTHANIKAKYLPCLSAPPILAARHECARETAAGDQGEHQGNHQAAGAFRAGGMDACHQVIT